MMMTIGGASFTLITNPQDIEESQEARFAKHKVLGAPLPVYEPLGGNEAVVTIKGVIFPEAIGSDGTITLLRRIKDAQVPVPAFRGDFRPMGWCVVTSVSSTEGKLMANGRGRKVEFTVKLEMVSTPAASLASQIIGFL